MNVYGVSRHNSLNHACIIADLKAVYHAKLDQKAIRVKVTLFNILGKLDYWSLIVYKHASHCQ